MVELTYSLNWSDLWFSLSSYNINSTFILTTSILPLLENTHQARQICCICLAKYCHDGIGDDWSLSELLDRVSVKLVTSGYLMFCRCGLIMFIALNNSKCCFK